MHQNRKGNSYLSGVNTENRTGRSTGKTMFTPCAEGFDGLTNLQHEQRLEQSNQDEIEHGSDSYEQRIVDSGQGIYFGL